MRRFSAGAREITLLVRFLSESPYRTLGHECCHTVANRVERRMKARFTSLFFLLVLAGGTVAGMPMPFGHGECGMDGMMNMDCCEAALMPASSPEVADAKLCCALNCAKDVTTSPPNVVCVTPPPLASASSPPALTQPLAVDPLRLRHIDRLHGPPHSGPAYLRNLALLI